MQKFVIVLVLITFSINSYAQKRGDSLAILYKRVYAYRAPGDLASRAYKFSYRNNAKAVYWGINEDYPGYFKLKISESEFVYIKADHVSADQSLSHEQIKDEIMKGQRKSSPNQLFIFKNKFDLPKWSGWLAGLVLALVLYLLWKKWHKLEILFYRKARKPLPYNLSTPWYIKWIVISGMLIGSLAWFAQKEVFWFMQEGFQIWGTYPNNYGWLMWAASMSSIIVALYAFILNLKRFNLKISVIYALLILIICVIYFYVGYLIGAVVLLIFILASGGGSKEVSLTGETKSVNGTTHHRGYDGNWYIKK